MTPISKHFKWRKQVAALALTTGVAFTGAAVSVAYASTPKTVTKVVALTGTASRITEKIDESKRTALAGHVRPFLKNAADHGAVDETTRTAPIMLMLSRTAKQQADLDAFVDAAHNKNSPSYHQWLTPAQFGARYQPADSDVLAVKNWLLSKGFTVLDVAPSKTFISFTGTVGQLRAAFHTEIHHFTINGEEHMATINEPEIPAALAPVIGGLNKLDDFSPKPLSHVSGTYKVNKATGKTTRVAGSAPYAPSFTTPIPSADGGGTSYNVGPQDFYTIYNENPLLASGITGAGQTIAVIEEVNVAQADVTTFRSQFGLPTYPATPNSTAGGVNYMIGNSTSGLGGYASCYAPVTQAKGKTSGEESEADIDLQWAGAVAPNAIVDFVACGGTKTSGDGTTLGSLGIDHAAQYIVNYLSSTVVSASMSYGECEADMSSSQTTGVGYYNNQWEQYAAEGITAIISSGDGGAEQCYQNGADATTLPPSVNGFGSSAYNVSAGGTDLGDLYESNNYTTIPLSTWWNTTNGPGFSSAVTYIPETTWAGYCSNELFSSYLQAEASTTFGTIYTPSGICSNATAKTDGLLAVVGAAGGISTYNTIPTWQSVYGVGLNSVSTTYRNIPDVSLYASNGWWGHALPFCESDEYACTYSNSTDAYELGAGGTSFVAPQLAGFMALVAQKTGQKQGQANYTFYNLASLQYGTTTTPASNLTACSGSGAQPGAAIPAGCMFNDISNDMPSLQGGTITPGIYQPCVAADLDCYQGLGTTYGVNTVPGTTKTDGILGYTASPGYDDATGLGSLNITSIVNGWNTASPTFASTTTLTSSAATVTPTSSVTLTATVTATGRGGTVAPAGSVEFYVGSKAGTDLGPGAVTSSCTGTGANTSCKGVATLTVAGSSLPTGSDSIVAYFGGDGANDAPSNSSAVTVGSYGAPLGNLDIAVDNVTASPTVSQADLVYIAGWTADAVDGSPLSNVTVYIDGNSVGTPNLGVVRNDVASYYNNPAYTNSGFYMATPASGLSVGPHSVTFTSINGGGVSSTFGPLTINVVSASKPPAGALDLAVDDHTATSTVSQADKLYTQGWAADFQTNGPVASVEITVDGQPFAAATLGVARPDVAAYYNNPNWTNTGYVSDVSASTLAVGPHTVSAYATDHTGLVTNFGTYTINVIP